MDSIIVLSISILAIVAGGAHLYLKIWEQRERNLQLNITVHEIEYDMKRLLWEQKEDLENRMQGERRIVIKEIDKINQKIMSICTHPFVKFINSEPYTSITSYNCIKCDKWFNTKQDLPKNSKIEKIVYE